VCRGEAGAFEGHEAGPTPDRDRDGGHYRRAARACGYGPATREQTLLAESKKDLIGRRLNRTVRVVDAGFASARLPFGVLQDAEAHVSDRNVRELRDAK
jgi:hypothetical protein